MRALTARRLGGLLLLCSTAASAQVSQVYKWKDAQGVTHFSDTPPAAGKAEIKSYGDDAPAAELPFALAEAVKNRPVTLYTTSQCEACDQGRALLRSRGIPYTEKTVNSNADHAALKQAGGAGQLPLLLIGRGKQVGFEQGAWDAALTAAAYPAQPMLPAGYRQPGPSPAAPAPAPRQSGAAAKAAAEEAQRVPPSPGARPDFQF